MSTVVVLVHTYRKQYNQTAIAVFLDALPHEAKDLNKQKAVSDIIAGVSFSTLR
jgi:hypothetical protein